MNDRDIADRWDKAAEVWTETVRSKGDLYREAVNNPALFRMLGPVKGKTVLDLGCGEGYNTRILAGRGAAVTGVDLSGELIRLAREKEQEEPLAVKYHKADAVRLSMFEPGSFEIVVAFMSLMDMLDLEGALSEVARVLRRGGRFVFSIVHPCFSRFSPELGWEQNERGDKLYYKVDRYFEEGPQEFVFTLGGGRITLPGKMINFHRTLASYFRALRKARLVVTGLEEPRPSQAAQRKYPEIRDLLRIPNFMVIEARKLPNR